MTAVMNLLKIFQFVSPALPAARHDIERLREVKQEIEQGIDSRDVLVADKVIKVSRGRHKSELGT
jgi:hypothetical protein